MVSGCAVWLTGLPGAGKSTIAEMVRDELIARSKQAILLSMDERRRKYVPRPTYTPDDRRVAYEKFAEEAARLAAKDFVVVMDGTGHKKSMRDYARKLVPCFCEVYLKCSLETAIQRESERPEGLVMAGLYEKALERQRTGEDVDGLGEVIGVDSPYEENPEAELVIDVDETSPEDACAMIVDLLESLPVN
ncbi:adenylyl-sulfate kinase [Oceanidesulfovibrio indonesiensis]|uniref:Adenylyl-sulfate kinase n=1 Tax=Oceanidesulfovibrio indonesiensis TaxID=54767 RepID=A0A7M3MH42_9BACT|nr:adenylyl-sulfate kinase [Oceanidesulfovibrio indonesiensis]TVM18795.1 adenylyl-sulfate kinase [Oceanidesulfovibrio indonesiensis]